MMVTLSGCGGNGSNPAGTSDTVQIAGGVSQVTVNAPTAIPATDTSTTVVVDGQPVVFPPSTTGYAAGEPVAIFRENVPIISNTTVADDAGLTRDSGVGLITIVNLTQGGSEYRQTGVLTGNAALLSSFAFKANCAYYVLASGLFTTSNPTNGTALTYKTLGLWFRVNENGVAGVPRSISGTLPANGSNTRAANTSLTAEFDGAFANKPVLLNLASDTSSLRKTVTSSAAVNGVSKAVFQDLSGTGLTIPASGLKLVQLYTDAL